MTQEIEEVLAFWESEGIFQRSIDERDPKNRMILKPITDDTPANVREE